MTEADTPSRPERRAVLLLVVLAFALRAGYGIAYGVVGENPRGYLVYLDMADGLLDGKGLGWTAEVDGGWRWAHRTPLYPLFLAAVRGAFGRGPAPIVLLQSLVGALSVVLAHRLARRGLSAGPSLLAAAGVAFYPYFVANDAAVGEQPILTALTLLVGLAAGRAAGAPSARRFAVVGLLLGACVMVRAAALPAAAFAILAVAAFPRLAGPGVARRLAYATVAFAAAFAVTLPWCVRNASRVGAFTLVTDGGRSLWIAHNEHTFAAYPQGSIDSSERIAWAALPDGFRELVVAARGDELAQDAIYRIEAARWIRAHASEMPARAARKVWALVDPRLSPPARDPAKEWAYRLSYAPVVLLALLGALRVLRGAAPGLVPPLLVGASLFAGAVVVSALYWAQTRLRVHLDPLLIVLAAAGAAPLPGVRRLCDRLDRRLAANGDVDVSR